MILSVSLINCYNYNLIGLTGSYEGAQVLLIIDFYSQIYTMPFVFSEPNPCALCTCNSKEVCWSHLMQMQNP